MKIKKIILDNIRSYEHQEVEFPDGSILLAGDIGSGKTSILLGIEFALFGLQPGQRGNALLRNGTDSGGVAAELEIEGNQVLIERTLKRGKSITQNYCAISLNGEEKKEIAVTELKSKVLELLNYPKEFAKKQNLLYKFTVYTPQEEMKEIILEDSETRINTLRHIFGIDRYKRILENTSLIISKIREERKLKEGITSSLEQDRLDLVSREDELEAKHYNLSSIEKELFAKTEIRARVEEDKNEISKKIEEKRRFGQEIEKTKLMISNKTSSIIDNKKLVGQILLQISELEKTPYNESQIAELENKIESLKKEKSLLDERTISINSQIASLSAKNDSNHALEQKMSNLEKCPTCLQDVDAVYRANILNNAYSDTVENNKQIESLEADKKSVYEKSAAAVNGISEKERELTELKILKVKMEGINEKRQRIEELERVNLSLEKDIGMLQQHISSLELSVSDLEKLEAEFQEKEKNFREAQSEERAAEIRVAELKKEIEVFSSQIEELRESIRKTEAIRGELNYLQELENWLGKDFSSLISLIEKSVMVKLKAEFSKSFSEWFNMLVSDSFNVRLGDDFTPVIEQQDYEIDYSYLSGGERTAIALAYRLSLNQVINSFLSRIKTRDLVILDEPTDGFSDRQLDKMRGVLEQLNVNQLIVVSHEQKMESFVDHIIKLKKDLGISGIEN